MAQPIFVPGITDAPPPSVNIPAVFFSILICVLGLLGNLIAIFVILVLREYKKSVTHWYVLQLAIADSLFLLTLPFKVNEDLNGGWIYPDWMCKAKETILFLNYYASIIFLVIMSIDRYIAVCHTFSNTVQKLRTQTSAVIITIAVWSISLLCCIPVMLYSFKIGVAPRCLCSYEFPKPLKNSTEECLNEKFISEADLKFCHGISTIPEIDNGEPFCQQFERQNIIARLGSGSSFTESGEEIKDLLTQLSSDEGLFFTEDESNADMSGSGNISIFGSNNPESSGNGFQNNSSSTNFIPDACHYWEHPIGWKVFISLNFLVAFVLPFLIMLISYGLIIQRLSKSKVRTSVKSVGSQKKKASSKASKDRKRVTIMCAALVSCFLICWLPFHAIHLAKFIGIPTTQEICTAVPKIGAILAYLNSALNPYLYSFLGTNFSKRWKLLKKSRGIQQFVSLAMWKQNDHSSSQVQRRENDKAAKQSGVARYSRQQSSDNKISTQRPTFTTRIAKENDYSQGTPSMQTADSGRSYSPKNTQNSSADEMLHVNGKTWNR